MADKKDARQIMDEELQRRLECYCSECKPGSEYSPIKPMGFKQFLPALIISIIKPMMESSRETGDTMEEARETRINRELDKANE